MAADLSMHRWQNKHGSVAVRPCHVTLAHKPCLWPRYGPNIVLARPDWHDRLLSSSACVAHTATCHIRHFGGGCVDTVSATLAKLTLLP